MKSAGSRKIHALEFECQAPLKFYEHCAACPRFKDECPDLALGIEILRGKNRVVYNGKIDLKDHVDAKAFNCLAPLNYFEKSRSSCAHQGRCREEGLLIALLNGKKELTYTQKAAVEIPSLRRRLEQAEAREVKAIEMAG